MRPFVVLRLGQVGVIDPDLLHLIPLPLFRFHFVILKQQLSSESGIGTNEPSDVAKNPHKINPIRVFMH